MGRLFGVIRYYLVACHGIAKNTGALIRGGGHLSKILIEREALKAIGALEEQAFEDAGGTNRYVSRDLEDARLLLYRCYGISGITSSLESCPGIGCGIDSQLERLLNVADNLLWEAGQPGIGIGCCLIVRLTDRVWSRSILRGRSEIQL